MGNIEVFKDINHERYERHLRLARLYRLDGQTELAGWHQEQSRLSWPVEDGEGEGGELPAH